LSDLVSLIMAYEDGSLNDKDVTKLFSKLIKSGQCWKLQGSYGRSAQTFIDYKVIDTEGKIDWIRYDELQQEVNHV